MRVRIRILAGAVVAATLLVGIGASTATQTDATFSDPENVSSSATLTAMRLVPPQIHTMTKCRGALLGGDVMVVEWKWISQTTPYAGFTSANAEWQIAGKPWQSVPTTGPNGSGIYTTTFDSGLLSGLLGSLLGESFAAVVRTKAWSGGWVSLGVTTLTYTKPILLGNPTCSWSNGS